jgi:polyisoprenyl-phosphate glycosyltransferase
MTCKDKRKYLSFIVPVYNEEDNVEILYRTVAETMASLKDAYDYEFVFTDNHSTDRTFAKLESLAELDPRVRIIRFSRNFGYQLSIFTGYANARGDAAIQLDGDLQDPPELIPEFLRQWEQGYDVVFGVRKTREEGWWIRNLRKSFYRIINLLSDDYLPPDAGDFRLVDRQILDAIARIEDFQPYLRGSIAAMGFKQIGVPYNRPDRQRGESKFTSKEMISLAVDGILNHSIIPLRIATYIGLGVSCLTMVLSAGYMVAKLFATKPWPSGFATTTVLILFSLGTLSLLLGIIGEYLGRIYRQVKKQPIVIVESTINMPEASVRLNCQ